MTNLEQQNEKEDDMSELEALLKKNNIDYTIGVHAGASPELLNIIGYYPTGKWHIMIGDISVIRGYCSFGMFEAFGGKYKKDPVRFSTAQELVDDLSI